MEELRITLPEKQWENVLKKAIRKTKINQRDIAYQQLNGLLTD